MKKEQVTIEKTRYSEKCPYCIPVKIVKGNSKKQVEWNIDYHIKQKHKGEQRSLKDGGRYSKKR